MVLSPAKSLSTIFTGVVKSQKPRTEKSNENNPTMNF